MRQFVLIGTISVCILLVVLLYKLNKSKTDYDNKFVALNRKVRDLTNLIELSNTKSKLLKEEESEDATGDESNPSLDGSNSNIKDQYDEFISSNNNYFGMLDTYENGVSEDVKSGIDNLVNNTNDELNSLEETTSGGDMATSGYMNVEDQMNLNLEPNELNVAEEVDVNLDEENVNECESVDVDNARHNMENAVGDLFSDMVFNPSDNTALGGNVLGEIVTTLGEGVVNLSGEVDVTLGESVDVNEGGDDNGNEEELVDTNEVLIEEINEENLEVNIETNTTTITNQTSLTVEELRHLEDKNKISLSSIDEMNVKQLQDLCREYRLKVKGRKDELIGRVKGYLSVENLA